jgi:hypothetical protein
MSSPTKISHMSIHHKYHKGQGFMSEGSVMYVKMSGVNEEQRDRVAAGVTVVVILVVPDELTVHSTTACIRRQVVLFVRVRHYFSQET